MLYPLTLVCLQNKLSKKKNPNHWREQVLNNLPKYICRDKNPFIYTSIISDCSRQHKDLTLFCCSEMEVAIMPLVRDNAKKVKSFPFKPGGNSTADEQPIGLFQDSLPLGVINLDINQFILPQSYVVLGVRQTNANHFDMDGKKVKDANGKNQKFEEVFQLQIGDATMAQRALDNGESLSGLASIEAFIPCEGFESNSFIPEETTFKIKKANIRLKWQSAGQAGSYKIPYLDIKEIEFD